MFADPLIDARHRLGLSSKAVAAAAGISAQFYNDIERGRRAPGLAVSDRLAAVLKLDPAYMHYLAGRFPPGNGEEPHDEAVFIVAWAMFNRALEMEYSDGDDGY